MGYGNLLDGRDIAFLLIPLISHKTLMELGNFLKLIGSLSNLCCLFQNQNVLVQIADKKNSDDL